MPPVTVCAAGLDLVKLRRRLDADASRDHLELMSLDLAQTEPFPLRPDFIIHAASAARTSLHRSDPLGTIAPNVFGTEALLRTAHAAKCEGFLYLSSGAVYGELDAAENSQIMEDAAGRFDHLNVAMSYAESKRLGELLCLSWTVQRGVPTRIVRLGHTYGPGVEETDERIFADFAHRIARGQNLVLHSQGLAVRPFCYITDAITGIFTVVLRGSDGEAYHLINAQAQRSMIQLARELCEEFAERGLRVEVRRGASRSNQTGGATLSTAKLESLGWQALILPREGFRRTVSAME